MIRKNAKVFALVLAIVMMLSTAAFAAEGDHFVNGKLKYSANQVRADVSAKNHVRVAPSEFQIEVEGKLYDLADANAAYEEDKANWKEILKGEDPSEDLKVVEVSAINDMTIESGKATDLKFLVNGTEELTKAEFDEKYGEEGYKVSFLYNKSGANYNKVTGKVTAIETFKYAVQVTDAEGNKLPETVVAKDFADVKVAVATKAVKVHELGLFADGKAWEHDTVSAKDTVKIAAAVYENALGQKNTDKDEDDKSVVTGEWTNLGIKNITSDKPTVAFYDKVADKIVVRKDGEVTFTVEFNDEKLEVLEETVKVTTKATQKLTTIEAKDLKVQAGTPITLDIKYLDQDGEELRDASVIKYYTSTEEAKTEAKTASILGDTLSFTKGNHTVNVYADLEMKTKVGTFQVEAVDVVDNEIDNFEIVKADADEKFEITVVGGVITKQPVTLNIEGYIDGVKVSADKVKAALEDNGAKFTFDIDEEVATAAFGSDRSKIEVTPVKAGTTTLKLIKEEGDFKTTLASLEITVESKVEAIDKLTLKEDTKVVILTDAADAAEDDVLRKQAVVDAVKEDIVANQIAKVELVEAQSLVIVTITDDFGGKEFTLDAKYVDGTVVRTEQELRDALVDSNVSAIALGNDIELTDWVKIERPVKLDGNNKTIFGVVSSNGPVLHLNSDNIEIKHVTIKSKEFNSAIIAGINIANGGHTGIVIDDVTFENTGYGVYANPDSDVTITNSIFKNLNSGIGIGTGITGKIEANEFSKIKNNYVENTSDYILTNSIIANNNFDTTPSIVGVNIKPAQ